MRYLACPVVEGVCAGGMVLDGGTVARGGAVLGAIPVVAGGLISLLAVLFAFPLVNTSAYGPCSTFVRQISVWLCPEFI